MQQQEQQHGFVVESRVTLPTMPMHGIQHALKQQFHLSTFIIRSRLLRGVRGDNNRCIQSDATVIVEHTTIELHCSCTPQSLQTSRLTNSKKWSETKSDFDLSQQSIIFVWNSSSSWSQQLPRTYQLVARELDPTAIASNVLRYFTLYLNFS